MTSISLILALVVLSTMLYSTSHDLPSFIVSESDFQIITTNTQFCYHNTLLSQLSHAHSLSADIAQCLPRSIIFLKTLTVGSIMNGGMISDGWSAFCMSCCPTGGQVTVGGISKADDGGAPGAKSIIINNMSWSTALGGACINILGWFGLSGVTPTFKPPAEPYKAKGEANNKVFENVVTDMLAAHTSNVNPAMTVCPS